MTPSENPDPPQVERPASEHPGAGPWGRRSVPASDGCTIQAGPLSLHFRQVAGELRIRPEYEGEREPAPWTRGAIRGWTGELQLSPVFADRPLIVQPEESFWLYRKAEARIYVRVPMSVRINAITEEDGEVTVSRVPTQVFSDTWWGSLEEGEVGFHIGTLARREVTRDLHNHWMCICPLHLRNRSRDDLHVDRIALRAQHLSVFTTATALWADETRVDYMGEDEGSRLVMVGAAPQEIGNAERISAAEIPIPTGFRARTFTRLKGAISEWF